MSEKINAKAWTHPGTGEVRNYVEIEDVAKLNGLIVERYKTGNICYAELNGTEISNSEAKRILGDVSKIWYTEDGKVNIKFYDQERIYDKGFWNGAVMKMESLIKEVD